MKRIIRISMGGGTLLLTLHAQSWPQNIAVCFVQGNSGSSVTEYTVRVPKWVEHVWKSCITTLALFWFMHCCIKVNEARCIYSIWWLFMPCHQLNVIFGFTFLFFHDIETPARNTTLWLSMLGTRSTVQPGHRWASYHLSIVGASLWNRV